MKRINPLFLFCLIGILISIPNAQNTKFSVDASIAKVYHPLASGSLIQDWSDPDVVVVNDDWSNVPSIEGFTGVFLTNNDETDPQIILNPDNSGQLNVFPNQYSPSTFHNSGVAEFDYYLIESIALSGSGTANAPYIKIYLNSLTCSDIQIKYNVKDLDGSTDNTTQIVALHYRNGASGNFINVPEAHIPDATEGPDKLGKITPVNVILPSFANNQSILEIRIMTADAYGRDEWVGIDDIEISGTCVNPYAEPIIPDCPEIISTYEGQSAIATFTASDQDGKVAQAAILSTPIQGIELDSIQPAQDKGQALMGKLLIGKDSPSGKHEIQLRFSNNDPDPQFATCTIPINIIPQSCPQTDTHKIGEIQGSGSSSPLDFLSNVTTSGVVSATFFEGGINGFFIQDPNGDGDYFTSDGLFISHSSKTIKVGQPLQISGSVFESFGRTQLVNITDLEVCGIPSNISPLPLSLPVNDQLDFEKYENMLVKFSQELYINEYYNFDRNGELVLGSQRHINPTSLFFPGSPEFELRKSANLLDRIILDDGQLTQNPNPMIHPNQNNISLQNLFRGGEKLTNIVGVLDYAYGAYRIQLTKAAEYSNSNPRPSSPYEVGGDIKVGSFNIMNYFTTLGSRGASDETELTRQREKLFAAIIKLDADILGLVEIENNEEAIQDLVDKLNLAIGEKTYHFIDTGIIGVDEIKVALIYKPASVTPVGNYALLDASIDNRFNDDKNRPSLAQTFSDQMNNKNFTIVVNHLKSKGSACDDINDLDLLDGAGNCNLTRLGAAQALVDWLASDPTESKSNNYLIIGDLNSYHKEQPIQTILSGGDSEFSTFDDYTDLIQQFLGVNAFSYVFDGQIGYLDHGIASNFLTQRVTSASFWHINADEPDFLDYKLQFRDPTLYSPDEFRSSDHDPILIGLNFSADIPPIAESRIIETSLEDEIIEIKLKAMDEFNRPLTYRIVDNPRNGNLELSVNVATYIPKANYFGTDSFTFVANNGIDDSNLATIMLNIQPINFPPTANPDTYEIEQNQTLFVTAPGVLENDSDVDNEILIAILDIEPINGTLLFNENGSFSYKPDIDFHGGVEFSYKAYDSKEYSSTTLVSINVNTIESSSNNSIYLPFIIR